MDLTGLGCSPLVDSSECDDKPFISKSKQEIS
jgi:hypothetical protein